MSIRGGSAGRVNALMSMPKPAFSPVDAGFTMYPMGVTCRCDVRLRPDTPETVPSQGHPAPLRAPA
jgi:hypothetical protein